jgi:hypothetical protein
MPRFLSKLPSLFAASIILASTPSAALAQDDVYSRYEILATKLVSSLKALPENPTRKDLELVAAQNAELQALGSEVMDIYGARYAECADQYAELVAELPMLASMSAADIEVQYHDGEGLPQAPGHCYFGRSLVVHPAMSAARLGDLVFEPAEREAVLGETEEVVYHVRTAKKRIEAPR